jgi:hypothetical protein
MKIEIAEFEYLYNGDEEPAFARVTNQRAYLNDDGQWVPVNNPTGRDYIKQVAVTNSGGVTTIDPFVGANEIDSNIGDHGEVFSTYTLSLHTSKGKLIDIIESGLRITKSPTSTTWGAIILFSRQAYPQPPRREYFDTVATMALLNLLPSQLDLAAKQDMLVSGFNIKSFKGVSMLGAGNLNPDLGDGSANLAEFANLGAALLAIGSTRKILNIAADTVVSSGIVIPDTLRLRFVNGAKLTKSGAGQIEFEGVGLFDPLAQYPVFQGFDAGDIGFTGDGQNRPAGLSTELWDTGNNSLSDRLDRADKSVADGEAVKIACFPRTVDTRVAFRQNREILFTGGDYPITLNSFFVAPFGVNNNTLFHGPRSARIIQPPMRGGKVIEVGAVPGGDNLGSYENVVVKGLTFAGHPNGAGSSAGSVIALGNCKHGIVTENIFLRTCDYTVQVGGYGVNGNFAEMCEVTDNQFIGCGTQVVAILNVKGLRVSGNAFDQKRSNGSSTYTIIDFEPNTDGDVVQRVTISDNFFDCRDYRILDSNFAASAVDVAGNSFNVPGHNLTAALQVRFSTTGTLPAPLVAGDPYYAIPDDDDNFRVAGSPGGTAINITTQGTGTHTVTPDGKNNIAILAQSTDSVGLKNITVRDNVIIGMDLIADNPTERDGPGGAMLFGIGISGCQGFEIANNTIYGGAWYNINASQSRDGVIHGNKLMLASTVQSLYDEIQVISCADCVVDSNYLTKTSMTSMTSYSNQRAGIQEADIHLPVTVDGDELTVLFFGPGSGNTTRASRHFKDLNILLNNATYNIESAIYNQIILKTSAGTIPQSSFLPAAVNTGTDTINIPGHGFVTGAKAYLISSGALPAHTLPPLSLIDFRRVYYVIRLDDNNIRLANSQANALAGTPIDFTDQGTGTHQIAPLIQLTFSNNVYSNNHTPDGVSLEPTGTSEILSGTLDRKITNVADADYTATKASGVIVYTSLTAPRTVTLPSAVGLRGKEIQIRDGSGNAATHNITVDGNGSETINGAATFVINSNWGGVMLKSDGANWKAFKLFSALVAGDLPSGIPATKIGGGTVNDTAFGRIAGLTGDAQAQLDAIILALAAKAPLVSPAFTTPNLGAAVAASLALGTGGTVITRKVKGTVTIDPASINANTVSSQTFTLNGAVVGDALTLNPPAAGLTAGLVVAQAFVSAADQITVVFFNQTGAPIDLASANWTYVLNRS